MKKFFIFLIAITVLAMVISVASAATITFDDIGHGGTIPDGYGGFQWGYFGYTADGSTSLFYEKSGYDHGSTSGDHVAFNKYGYVASISSNDPFNFEGAYFTGAWNDELLIDISGFLDGNLEYQETILVNTTAPIWFGANYIGINSLVFSSDGGILNPDVSCSGTPFVMDDFSFNTTVPVPEPTTILLLGSGLIGIARFVHRRKRK